MVLAGENTINDLTHSGIDLLGRAVGFGLFCHRLLQINFAFSSLLIFEILSKLGGQAALLGGVTAQFGQIPGSQRLFERKTPFPFIFSRTKLMGLEMVSC